MMPGSLRAFAVVLRQRDVDIELVIVARTLDEQSLANRLRDFRREVDVLRELRLRAGLHVAQIRVRQPSSATRESRSPCCTRRRAAQRRLPPLRPSPRRCASSGRSRSRPCRRSCAAPAFVHSGKYFVPSRIDASCCPRRRARPARRSDRASSAARPGWRRTRSRSSRRRDRRRRHHRHLGHHGRRRRSSAPLAIS